MSLFGLLLCIGLALAERDDVESRPDQATRIAQAQLFIKKRWYEDAAKELQAVLDTPEGQRSFQAHWMAAQVAWELLDLDWAMSSARSAFVRAPDDETANRARSLVESYERNFGFVEISAPHVGMSSRLQLELTSVLFDAELADHVKRVALAWRERMVLPLRMGLPAGTYLINGSQVTINALETTSLQLPMSALGSRGLAALQVTRTELSGGVGFLQGERTAQILPAAQVQFGVVQPIGRILLGPFMDLGIHERAHTNQTMAPLSWAGGLRIGTELQTRMPLAIRPSVQVRYGLLPGIPMDCQWSQGMWSCGAPEEGINPQMSIDAVGRHWSPGMELAIDYRQAGRTTAFGFGIKIAVDRAFGSIPASSTALLADTSGGTVLWNAQDQSWTATGIRIFNNLSFVF